MFFNILGNLEPRPLACAAQGCPVSCPGRGQPWKYLRQRTRPRVTARRCPMRRTPSRRRQFEGRPLAGALSRGRGDGCWWGPSSACTSGAGGRLQEAGAFAPTTRATRAAIVRKKRSLQPEAVEQMQLRGRRRIDGVGRPEFDFYTGLRGTGLRGTLIRALASAARRRRPALRARSSCAPRVVVWPRVSASILSLEAIRPRAAALPYA